MLAGASPEPDVSAVPVGPVSLFVTWLRQAVAAGVPEPHAMTLSTVDAHGMPRGRVLILKAVDEHGWHFAVSSVSQKGRDLAVNPVAALTFYWPALVRQVRIIETSSAMAPELAAMTSSAAPWNRARWR